MINCSPAKSLQNRTLYELWTKRKPDLSNMRIFGCKALAHVPKELRQKWDEKSRDCLFIGYLEHSKGYRLFDTKTEKVFKDRDVVFLERKRADVARDVFMHRAAADEPENTNDAVEADSDSSDESYGDASQTGSHVGSEADSYDSEREDNTIVEIDDEKDGDADQPQPQQEEAPTPRHSGRAPKPRKFQDYVTYNVLAETAELEPASVQEVLNGPHRRE